MCVTVYLCACNAQPAVFNAVPEGFNPDYQEYKVTESPSQPSLTLSVHTQTHKSPHSCFPFFNLSHTRLHTQKGGWRIGKGWALVGLSSRGCCVSRNKASSWLVCLKQTMSPHGCDSTRCVKTSDQPHSA